jgi:glucose-1-phosphate cytidylyltransferase
MSKVPVVILCGGRGTRLNEMTGITPKPLVKIGEEPIIWHIMKWFMKHSYDEFYLLTGYLHEEIERYFLHRNYAGRQKITVSDGEVTAASPRLGCTVHMVNTGASTGIAGRIKRVEGELSGKRFMLTYGDGIADVDLCALMACHDENCKKRGSIATISVVQPYSKFGVVDISGEGAVEHFREKPRMNDYINIGFMVMEPGIFGYLRNTRDEDMLERDVLPKVAQDGKIYAYRHPGEFRAMDSYKDYVELNSLWSEGRAFWRA